MRAGLSITLLAASLLALPAAAQANGPAAPYPPPPSINVEQRIDQKIPLDLEFRDEKGAPVRLGAYFGSRPVVLALVYYGCPMLCGQVLSGVLTSVKTLPMDVGEAFDVVVVSFDPKEGHELAAAKKAAFVERYKRPTGEQGWHFLTGDAPSIERLTDAVGFRYEYDAKQKQYAHAAAIMVLTPDGRLARYFFGTEYSPRDLRFALVEASQGKVGGLADRLMLLCYRYDPRTGSYSATAIGAVRAGGVATVAALGGFIAGMLRRERRRRRETRDEEARP
jgi:protein SCO1/2